MTLPRPGARPYVKRGIDWSDPAQVNAYKRKKLAEWRLSNHKRYREGAKRWHFNRKLRECGLAPLTSGGGQ